MALRMFLVAALLLAAGQAGACTYEAQPLADNVAAAKIAFIGSVRTVENGLVTFTIEKIIKGAKEGDSFDADLHPDKGNCGIPFKPGERWLYLGNDAPTGSLLLQDEFGRVQADNLAAAKKFAPGIADVGSDVQTGTSKVICVKAPGGPQGKSTAAGMAFRLDNGMSVTINADPDEFRCPTGLNSYSTAKGASANGASIIVCPHSGGNENLPCQSAQGTVTVSGSADPDILTGQIRTQEGEYHRTVVFLVKRLKDEAQCDIRAVRSGACTGNAP
jgi:hypothetical protein